MKLSKKKQDQLAVEITTSMCMINCYKRENRDPQIYSCELSTAIRTAKLFGIWVQAECEKINGIYEYTYAIINDTKYPV